MKKQNLKSLTLNKKSISNLHIGEIKGGIKTWLNAECATNTCEPSLKCEPASRTCYYSCVVCDS